MPFKYVVLKPYCALKSPRELWTLQILWALPPEFMIQEAWGGAPESGFIKYLLRIPMPVGCVLHFEKQCYKLFSVCKEGKRRACVMKLCREIEQYFNLILILNNREIWKSVLGRLGTCQWKKKKKDACIEMRHLLIKPLNGT